jgi:SAM-dependent methyltransferase
MIADASWLSGMPEIYDRCLGPAIFAPFADHVADLAAALYPKRVLELAAGTGIVTAALQRELPEVEIVATDLNPAMVEWAAARLPGPRWQQADAQRLSYPEASFELVVCQFGAMFFPDKPAAFAEIARVLTPGGTLLCTVWDELAGSELPAALVASCEAVLPDDPPGFVTRLPHGYADPDRIGRDVRAGGLELRRLDRVVLTGTTESTRALAEGFCLGTPLRFELAQRGVPEELTERIATDLVARIGPGPVTGSLAAFLIDAQKAH